MLWVMKRKTHQLTILAVSGLVRLTKLMPPRRSTSLLTPATCISLTLVLPFPNWPGQLANRPIQVMAMAHLDSRQRDNRVHGPVLDCKSRVFDLSAQQCH